MKQIELLKRIISTPNIFRNEWQRFYARENLEKKLKRRDKKIKQLTQTKLWT